MARVALALPLVLALFGFVAGCVAPLDEDDGDTTASASSRSVPEYDAVVRGGTKVETDRTRSATQSARTRLVGYLPGATAPRAMSQLLDVARWTEIEDAEGEAAFQRARVSADERSEDGRIVDARLTLDNGVAFDVRAVATTEDDDVLRLRITNTSGYRHWLAGRILDPNALTIDVKLVPYASGVIMDATVTAKLRKMEDRAVPLTTSIELIFNWLAQPAR
jgi:hypothetical protein